LTRDPADGGRSPRASSGRDGDALLPRNQLLRFDRRDHVPAQQVTSGANSYIEFSGCTIAGAHDSELVLELYDVHGRRIRRLMEGRRTGSVSRHAVLDAGDLPAGIYFLRLRHGGAETSRRVAVIR
jgi:hypothetical protein